MNIKEFITFDSIDEYNKYIDLGWRFGSKSFLLGDAMPYSIHYTAIWTKDSQPVYP